MRFVLSFIFGISLLLQSAPAAAPMTVKDVAFMVRMGITDPEVIAEVEKRRLLSPIDQAGEQALHSSGASPALINKLKAGNYALSSSEAALAQQRMAALRAQTERQQALDREAFAARQRQLAITRSHAVISGRMLNDLDGKLVKVRGDQVVPFHASDLKHVRLFLIYNSAHWCGPCRQFTPKLVDFYKRMKPQHPDMEVIFLSSDRDEFNMANYMRWGGMPWPAMRFGSGRDVAQKYCGDSIPWLVVVNDQGKALTQNGIDKKALSADAVLAAIETRLNETKR